MSYATVNCPECGEEVDVEGEVIFGHDDHPYGSTTAREHHVEVEVYGPLKCPECSAVLDKEWLEDELIAEAEL